MGRSRGGFSTKLQRRCDGHGRLLAFALTGGERHDQLGFGALVDSVAVRRPGRRRPRSRPNHLIANRAYASHGNRRDPRKRGIHVAIPRKRHERCSWRPISAVYRERNCIERLVNRLKPYRRIATRYEKRAASYAAFVTLAAIEMWV